MTKWIVIQISIIWVASAYAHTEDAGSLGVFESHKNTFCEIQGINDAFKFLDKEECEKKVSELFNDCGTRLLPEKQRFTTCVVLGVAHISFQGTSPIDEEDRKSAYAEVRPKYLEWGLGLVQQQ